MGLGFLNLKLHPNWERGRWPLAFSPKCDPHLSSGKTKAAGEAGRPPGLSKDAASVLLGQARPPPSSTPPLRGLFLLLENRPE